VRLAGPEALVAELRRFLADRGPAPRDPRSHLRMLLARWPEALAAVGASGALWFLLVPGSTVSEFERSVPVVVENLPQGYELASVEPAEVQVVFRGSRRSVYLVGANAKTEAHVDALLAQLGRRTFEIGPDQVRHPDPWTPIHVEPGRIRLQIVAKNGAPAEKPPEKAPTAEN
jgi:hypothetical protein